MSALGGDTIIGVVGAGAMGAGIAQVAAMRGHRVVLADAAGAALARAKEGHAKAMHREVEKGKLARDKADVVLARISFLEGVGPETLRAFSPCGLVVEAIVEDLAVKRELFRSLETVLADDAVLASNTSSLSITALSGGCRVAERVVGLHFFNPAPVMPLVEVIPAITTTPEVAAGARALMEAWGKTTVVAADTPGFIVNRIARPFYGEALCIAEEHLADMATIDWAMRDVGGFRMGPFELMDFVGNDVNFAVTCSVFQGTFHDSRYRPSIVQRRLVDAGFLGRKAQRGYYDYREGAPTPEPNRDPVLARSIVDRIVAMLINEAVEAVRLGLAAPRDIETAMTKGVNYPKGLLAWGDEIGVGTVLARLEALHAEYGDDRYRPSPLLRHLVRTGGTLL